MCCAISWDLLSPSHVIEFVVYFHTKLERDLTGLGFINLQPFNGSVRIPTHMKITLQSPLVKPNLFTSWTIKVYSSFDHSGSWRLKIVETTLFCVKARA